MGVKQSRRLAGGFGFVDFMRPAAWLLGLFLITAAHAQDAAPLRHFDQPAGDLAAALDRFAEQGSAQVLYTPELVRGRQAPALSGDMSLAQALQTLLGDSGLRVEFVNDSTIVLHPPAAPAPARSDAGSDAVPDAAADAVTIGEVIVTARRRLERQQDVPLAITTLSGDFLQQNNISKLDDVSKYVPALHIDTYNTPTTTNIGVRGVRSANIAPGQDSAVGFYVGDVNYAYTIGIGQLLFDMQSLEVLKGPQGTLFGRNSTGGAVLATPAKPTRESGVMASVGSSFYNGDNGMSSTLVVNAPISDRLQLRAAVQTFDAQGTVENRATPQTATLGGALGTTNFRPLGDQRSQAWRLSALYEPIDSVESYFMYQGSHLRTNGNGFSINALNPDGYAALVFGDAATQAFERRQQRQKHDFWTTETDVDTGNGVETHAFSNATTWKIGDALTLKNIAGYRKFDLDDTTDFDGMPLPVLTARLFDRGHEVSEELQLQGTAWQDAFNWVAGLYYSDQHINHGSDTLILAGALSTDHSIHDNQSYAVFAQGTYRIAAIDGLSLTAGVRGTRDERKMVVSQYDDNRTQCALADENGDESYPLDACAIGGKKSYTEPTYNVSLDYKADADTLFYLAHRRGYRTGGFSYTGSSKDTIGPFAPEFVTDVEAGIKKDWHLGTTLLRTNLAAYYSDYKDIQRYTSRPESPSRFLVVNAASADIKGGELELTFIPVRALELRAFYALTVAEYKKFLTGSGDFSDNSFAQTPKQQYSLSASYRLPLDPRLGVLTARSDYSWQSHVFYTDTEQGDETIYGPYASQGQGAYGLLDFALNWEAIGRTPLGVALFVHNATNEKTKPFGVQLYNALGTNSSTIGAPRVIGAELSYRFNM